MRILSVSFIIAFCINAYANAEEVSRDCREESQRYTQTCQDATTVSHMNNSALGEQMRTLAGTDPKINEGGAMEKRVYNTAYNNSKNSFDSCRQQRKKLKETCDEAYKKEEAGKNDPKVKKEITDNYEKANKDIAGYINTNAERMAGYQNAGSMAGATIDASADAN
jgi:hypothetical protein